MNLDIEQIAEIDRLNMAPIIEKAGGYFDPEFRKQKLFLEIKQGAVFLQVWNKNQIIAYIEYIPQNDGSWMVASVQVHPNYKGGGVLRKLLYVAYTKLKTDCPTFMHTSVHNNNIISLKLHNKLGFKKIEQNKERVFFEIEGKKLRDNLAVFVKA